MSARHVRWVLLAVTVLLLALATMMPASLPDERGQGWPFFLLLTAQALTFSTVGLVLVGAQPRNAVSWLFAVVGVFVAVYLFTERYQYLALVVRDGELPFGPAASWLQTWLYVPALGVVTTLLPLLFPDGRLVSRRWRPALVLAAVASAGILLSDATAPGVMSQSTLVNPVGLDPRYYPWLSNTAGVVFVISAVVGFASLVRRWQVASYAERQQLKWFAYFALLIPTFVVTNAVVNLLERPGAVPDRGQPGGRHGRVPGAARRRRDLDPALPPLRHRPGHQADGRLRGADHDPGRGVPRLGAAAAGVAQPPDRPVGPGRRGLHAGGGGPLPAAAGAVPAAWWTAGSSGPGTTPSSPSRSSPSGCATSWTSRRCRATCARWCTGRCARAT